MTKIGTLAELNVKPGDVVEFVEGYIGMYPEYKGKRMVGRAYGVSFDNGNGFCGDAYHKFRIVSRASDSPKPNVETVHLMNFHELAKGHAIVFTVKDGKPDCTSIKMEKL